MSLLSEALDAHFTRLGVLAGEVISYSDGATTVTGVTAVKSRPRSIQIDAAESFMLSSKNWEFLVRYSDIGREPKLGHTITDSSGVQYRVQPSNTTDNPWRWSDGQHTFVRIFVEQQ